MNGYTTLSTLCMASRGNVTRPSASQTSTLSYHATRLFFPQRPAALTYVWRAPAPIDPIPSIHPHSHAVPRLDSTTQLVKVSDANDEVNGTRWGFASPVLCCCCCCSLSTTIVKEEEEEEVAQKDPHSRLARPGRGGCVLFFVFPLSLLSRPFVSARHRLTAGLPRE